MNLKIILVALLTFLFLTLQTFYLSAQTYNVCTGESIDLNLPAYTGSLQWQQSSDSLVWNDISGATYQPYNVTATSNIFYRAKVVNGTCNPVYSATKKINILASPSITTNPDDQTLCAGSGTSFTIVATGVGLVYQWQVSTDGGTIFNNITAVGFSPSYSFWTTSALSLNGAIAGNSGNKYRCVVSGQCAPTATSNEATLTVNTIPTGVTATATPNPVWEGATLALTGNATGATTWSWSGPGFSSSLQSPEITGITTASIGIYSLTASNTCGSAAIVNTSSVNVLGIGSSYQGGIIAYILQPSDPGYIAGQVHGLIATPNNQTSAEWGCKGTLMEAWDEAIGTGWDNTLITAGNCGTVDIAANFCFDLILGGYDDWYMPSKDELNKLYINRIAIGGFATGFYWSSSESEADLAWGQAFIGVGSQYPNVKDAIYYVRAIRSF